MIEIRSQSQVRVSEMAWEMIQKKQTEMLQKKEAEKKPEEPEATNKK